jgi:hypothetical protein
MFRLKKKFQWILRRHPLLYLVRFAMICRNLRPNENLPEFQDINDKEEIDELFFKINDRIKLQPEADELDKALQIAIYLRMAIKGGRGLGFSSATAMRMMMEGKGGICSDYSQIFNLFCLINDIRVREWGCVERFYNPKYGHTFNEIYSSKLQRWVLIDMGKNLIFTNGQNQPLDAISLFRGLRKGEPLIYKHFSDHICIDMYKIGITYSEQAKPFVIENYHNKTYDAYLNKYQETLPSFLINALMILKGLNYRYVFPLDDYKKLFFMHKRKKEFAAA